MLLCRILIIINVIVATILNICFHNEIPWLVCFLFGAPIIFLVWIIKGKAFESSGKYLSIFYRILASISAYVFLFVFSLVSVSTYNRIIEILHTKI